MPRSNRKHLPEAAFYRDLGRTIRLTRVAAGKSQTEAADHIDVTFQQIQKYEAGTNRIPLDRLVSLSGYLDVPLSHFVGDAETDSAFHALIEQFNSKECRAFLESWTRIKDRRMRAAILGFVKSMAALSR